MVPIFLVFVFFVGVCSGATGVAGDNKPIDIRSYPSLVQVERYDPYGNSWGMMCAGNILSPNVILSAAHCVHIAYDEFYYPEFRRIRAGTSNRGRDGVIENVANVINHPYFHNNYGTIYADISIIILRSRLSFGEAINSVSIIPADYEIPDNSAASQAGWGYNPSDPESNVIRNSLVLIVNHQLCSERYGGINQDGICTSVVDASPGEGCVGDYGGPVYFGGVLAGIYSWGSCDINPTPGVSIKISDYTQWIINNTT